VPQASAALLPGGAVARQGVVVLVVTVAGVGLQALWWLLPFPFSLFPSPFSLS